MALTCTFTTMYIITYRYNKIDNWQRPSVKHRELCSIFCNNLYGKTAWKRMDTYVCVCIYIYIYICVYIYKTQSLCYAPEINIVL